MKNLKICIKELSRLNIRDKDINYLNLMKGGYMVDKILSCILAFVIAFICYLSHVDRNDFLRELENTRREYVMTLSNMQNDIKEVKTDVKIIKEKIEKSTE